MTMKTETTSKTVVLGLLSGAVITSALIAFDFWIFTYTDTRSGFLGDYSAWAGFVAIAGAVLGLIAGALLGIFLSFVRRGSLFGALVGASAGIAGALLIFVTQGTTSVDTRDDLMIAAFVPIGAISGFLTSLIVSATISPSSPPVAQPKRHNSAVLGLQQNTADESGPEQI